MTGELLTFIIGCIVGGFVGIGLGFDMGRENQR
jgi:hypothetical protein